MATIHDASGRGLGAENPLPISTFQKKFRDSFSSPDGFSTSTWNIVNQPTGFTFNQTNGELNIVCPTTGSQNAEFIMDSVDTFTVPYRMMFAIKMPTRQSNQDVFVEMVAVDKDLNPLIPAREATLAWQFTGTSATSANAQVRSNTLPVLSASHTVATTTAYQVFEIEHASDEVWHYTRLLDSVNGRATATVRQQMIPEPNQLFKIRVRIKHGATAPVSANTVSLQYITVMDYTELTAEITASRGSAIAGQAMPVQVTTMPTTVVTPRSALIPIDAHTLSTSTNHVITHPILFNGSTYDRQRKATVFKSLAFTTAVGGTTNVWTPTSAKKFRVMGLTIAGDGDGSVYLRDGGTTFATLKVANTNNSTYIDLGEGYLSTTANNSFGLFNNGVVAPGNNFYVTVWGTEE